MRAANSIPENEQLVVIVGEWVQKAENDLTTAAHVLKMGSVCPTDTVCFHAQQCVEKYVKARLVLKRVDFPRTHDLEWLVSLLPRNCKLPIHAEERSQLTDYAAGARYPGWDVISLS